jgi:hypothetical protein
MKKIPKLFLYILTVFIFACLYIYVLPFFKTSEKNLEKMYSEVSLNSNELVGSFIKNEKESNELYVDKIIEVVGTVKEVSLLNNKYTILLYSEDEKSGIICEIHKSQLEKVKNLMKNQKIKVKGICKGFLKDVILLNCYIDLKLNEKE